jgi:zinc transporter ZupT
VVGESEEQTEEHARPNVAISMWLGLVLDGIPESVMLGFMTNGGEVTFSFLLALFVANFPEAFAGAAALQRQGMSALRNVGLWSSVFFLTGALAMVGSLVMPTNIPKRSWIEHVTDDLTMVLQGFTGGAMLAMVATAMMPEAYHGSKNAAGIMFMLGFGLSVFIDGLGARFGHPQTVVMNGHHNRTSSQ